MIDIYQTDRYLLKKIGVYLGLELMAIAISVSNHASAPSQASNHHHYNFVRCIS